MSGLRIFNLVGVLLLAALCATQWKTNRELNLRTLDLEKKRIDLTTKQQEQEKAIHGLTADLDSFRERFETNAADLTVTRKSLRTHEEQVHALTAERDQLREITTNWVNAVKLRDTRLREANGTITNLAAQLRETIEKYNAVVTKYNALVTATNPPAAPPNPSK
jgi:chromosome segregation ATPase